MSLNFVGFDPSFIDTILRVEDEHQKLSTKLPKIGYHHRNSRITRIAGGNGVNIAWTLKQLGIDVILVVPTSREFVNLLKKRGIKDFISINADINETVGINIKQGDIQFNHVKGGFGHKQWTDKIQKAWCSSQISTFLNWGLNPMAVEWVCCQILSLCGFDHQTIENIDDLYQKTMSLNTDMGYKIQMPCLLEPGSLIHHHQKSKLYNLIEKINSLVSNDIAKYLLFNEEEANEYLPISFSHKIHHSDSFVRQYYFEENNEFEVPPLISEPNTFMGSGDAFFSGILLAVVSRKLEKLVPSGIKVAQAFLNGNLNDLKVSELFE